MTKREQYEAKTEAFLLPLMEEYRIELVDVEYVKGGLLREVEPLAQRLAG